MGKFVDPGKEDHIADDQYEETFYREADALEDSVLFLNEQLGKALYKGNKPAVERFSKTGPDFARFIEDASTTDEEGSICSDEDLSDDEESNRLLTEEENMEDDEYSETDHDEGSGIPQSLERQNSDDQAVVNKYIDEELGDAERNPHQLLDILPEEHRQDLIAIKHWKSLYKSRFQWDPDADFMTFLDREKSKRRSPFLIASQDY